MKISRTILLFSLVGLLCMTDIFAVEKTADPLGKAFDHPPEAAKPLTWWHWISGNVSKEGITADLEAMKQIGLGGAQIFWVDQSAIKGAVQFMSPEWKELIKFTVKEAARLDLEIYINACDGWSESGAAWVTPEESMQKVVWTERQVSGGKRVSLDLPLPEAFQGYYRDIGVFAFPTPTGEVPPADKITSNAAGFEGTKFKNAPREAVTLTYETPVVEQWVQFEYNTPVTIGSVALTMMGEKGLRSWDVQTSEDGVNFRKIASVFSGESTGFEPVTARFFRVFRPKGTAKTIQFKKFEFGRTMLPRLDARVGMIPFGNHLSLDENEFVDMPLRPEEIVKPTSIINLTGKSDWEVPPGNYTILRMGHTSTGKKSHPSNNAGLEVNKFSEVAVRNFLNTMFGFLLEDCPELVGTTFRGILLDSWEAGCQNWTDDMVEQFTKRRGYDLTPWLPALTGSIIGSAEETQRFLRDFRRTQADLIAEMHYGTTQKFAHEHGLKFMAEATGIKLTAMSDQLQAREFTDIPMGEFWVNDAQAFAMEDLKEAASVAHVYGQNIAAAEAFTAAPRDGAWKNDPFSLKALGDRAFCMGINLFVFHRYAHQPWLDRVPGMSMGPFGINFERTNTWWEPGKAWIEYLTRSQAILQAGRFSADLCYFYGENAPATIRFAKLDPPAPAGYGYDFCNADAILDLMSVEDGRFVLPSGMKYRMLILPPVDRMTLSLLRKIETLVKSGGSVYGPKPTLTPNLKGFPQEDVELAKLANEIWGNCDGKTVLENLYGKGRVVWGMPIEKALSVKPDFSASRGKLLFIHRQVSGAEVYFVSNQKGEVATDCTFRVTGMIPELWHPDTGHRETLAQYKDDNLTTTVPLHFSTSGSAFVVFRHKAPSVTPVASLKLDGQTLDPSAGYLTMEGDKVQFSAQKAGTYELTTGNGLTSSIEVADLPAPEEISGPWEVIFPPKLGAPDKVVFDKLMSWTDSSNGGVKYFSGTATYIKDFVLPKVFTGDGRSCVLDLGDVKNLAEVTLNGKNLGVLWQPPFRLDITEAMRPGDNHLEVKVTNLWPNRLIGDQSLKESERVTWASVSLFKAGDELLPSGLLGPVIVHPRQKISF